MADPADRPDPQDPPETDPPAPDPSSEPPEQPAGAGGEPSDQAKEVEKWKSLARKHERDAKSNADARRRLTEIEDADKSDLEKANARIASLEGELGQERASRMRAEVAARKGLTADQAKRLQGTTEDELEADADELVRAFKPEQQQETPPNGGGGGRPPVPKLKPGAVPGAGAVETDPRKLAEQIPRSF